MKIGIIADSLHNNTTGVGKVSSRTFEYIIKLDIENQYFLIERKPQQGKEFQSVERLTYTSINIPVFGRFWRDYSIRNAAGKVGLDIVHDMANGGLPKIKMECVGIQTVHDLIPLACPSMVSKSALRWYKYTIPKVLEKANVIIAVSNSTKNDLIRYLHIPYRKIHVVYNGVDEYFRPVDNANEIMKQFDIGSSFILYVGNIHKNKNIATLIKSYHEVRKKGIRHKLVLAGPYQQDYKKYLDILISKLGIKSDVIFLGYINDGDLPKLYGAADLFVYPSFYEGFGIPPLEAMACGTPVITSNTSSLPEVVGDAGSTIEPEDTRGLAELIQTILTDSTISDNMKKRGLERAKMFTWEKCAREVLGIYKETVKRT